MKKMHIDTPKIKEILNIPNPAITSVFFKNSLGPIQKFTATALRLSKEDMQEWCNRISHLHRAIRHTVAVALIINGEKDMRISASETIQLIPVKRIDPGRAIKIIVRSTSPENCIWDCTATQYSSKQPIAHCTITFHPTNGLGYITAVSRMIPFALSSQAGIHSSAQGA